VAFKKVSFSEIPVIEVICARVKNFFPGFAPLKAGGEFDKDVYRICFDRGEGRTVAVDLRRNLLNDIAENREVTESSYTKELLAKLDEIILGSFRRVGII
jgi:hypothetical protein